MCQERSEDTPAVPQSLKPLALIAVKNAGADGFAIYRVNPGTGLREAVLAWGVPVPESNSGRFATASYPLRGGEGAEAILAFVFQDKAIDDHARAILARISLAIESVWCLTSIPGAYARKAARIGELETELADAKIADRARGLVATAGTSEDAVDIITRHVESVLRPGQLATELVQLAADVEQQIEDRSLANRAKYMLQSQHGMSEDEAHVHLRLVSRQSRKRLSDVARELLGETVPHAATKKTRRI